MARLYGRLVENFGFREVRELSVIEVMEHLEYWRDAPPLVDCIRHYLGYVRADETPVADAGPSRGSFENPMEEVTPGQYEQLRAIERADEERNGRRNPFL